MKKTILITVILMSVLCFLYVQAKHFWRGELMSVKQVCKRWGEAPLDVSKFKTVDGNRDEESIRAKMTCSLLRNQKQYIGKTTLKIWKLYWISC